MTVLILNGPNLNMLGRREPELYGTTTLAEIEALCRKTGDALGLDIDFRQSNHEGELVGWIQDALDKAEAIVINASAYTHTSVAILDALKLHTVPIVEVHLTDPAMRESFRHFSYVEQAASHCVKGKGANGYVEALTWLASRLE